MRVTVKDLSNAACAGLAAVTAETAGYFVLAAADQLAGSMGRLGAVLVGEDGSVTVERLGEGSAAELEADLRALLAQLLGLSSVRVPALQRAADAKEPRGLLRLSGEIEAALIPVNRAAARRALSRLHRDAVRAKASGKLSEQPVAEPTREVVSPPPVRAPANQPPAVLAPEQATLTPIVPALASFEPRQQVPEHVSEPMWVAGRVDATPFLGTWTTVAPLVPSALVVLEPAEHDTDRAVPVEFDVTPAPDLVADGETAAEPAFIPATTECSSLVTSGVVSADPAIAYPDLSNTEVPRAQAGNVAFFPAAVEPEGPSSAEALAVVAQEPCLPLAEALAVVAQEPCLPLAEALAVVAQEPCPPYRPRKSDVAALVAGFEVAESRTLLELSRELKRMAEVGATPEPPSSLPGVAGATLPR